MVEHRPDARQYMNAIFNRLLEQEGVAFEAIAAAPDPLQAFDTREDKRLLDAVMGKPSTVRNVPGRGLVAPLGLQLLEQRVQRVRQDLFENGQDWTVSSDFQNHGETMDRTTEECQQLYWRKMGMFMAHADKQEPQSQGVKDRTKLWMQANDGDNEVEFAFGNDNSFWLRIGFGDPTDDQQRTLVEYHSSQLPVKEMAGDEFRIINHYLDQYTQATGQEG